MAMSVRDIISSILFYAGAILISLLLIRIGTRYGFEKADPKFTQMEPRIERGHYVWVNRHVRRPEDLDYGDIIAYQRPPWKRSAPKQEFARVLGKPGDLVEMRRHKLFRAERLAVSSAGTPGAPPALEQVGEPYANPRHAPTDFSAFVVPRNTVFVLFDDRDLREPLRNCLVPARSIYGRMIE